MLFTALLKVREGSTTNERIMRRAQYSFPEGAKPITEYWLQSTDPSHPHVVATFEADSVEPLMALLADWDDHFHARHNGRGRAQGGRADDASGPGASVGSMKGRRYGAAETGPDPL